MVQARKLRSAKWFTTASPRLSKKSERASLLLATALFTHSASAHAETVAIPNAALGEKLIGTSKLEDIGEETLRVTIGRGIEPQGKPIHSVRAVFSDTATIVTFSRRDVKVRKIAPTTTGFFGTPLTAARAVTSGFGVRVDPILGTRRSHSGIDIAAPHGSPIAAVFDGTVSLAGWNGGYGLYVSIEHAGGLQTRYGHMSKLNVADGQTVRKGDVIGFVGSTGRSTGPHLHYETRVNGRAVKPQLP